jgi:tetratricopeptide (TPR) repeat protein
MSIAQQTIFLSYGRSDDHPDYHDENRSFMRQLYNDLTAQGYHVWWDRVSMPSRSLTFLKEIERAINGCNWLILVVGPNALGSEYVQAEWQHAYYSCKPIIPLLRHGDYDSIPDELKSFHSPDFRKDAQYQTVIKELFNLLSQSAPLAQLYKVPALQNWYVDRKDDIELGIKNIRAHLENPGELTGDQNLVVLHGLGGSGKSTLAAALAQDCRTRRTYVDGVFWLDIGKKPDLSLHMGDIGVVFGDNRDEYPDLERAKLQLSRVLAGRSALIVLDDVWDHEVVNVFSFSGNQCCILVTTRNEGMARLVGGGRQSVDVLKDEESTTLLQKRIGLDTSEVDPSVEKILSLLGNHTLAVNLVAAKLSGKSIHQVQRYADRLEKRIKQGSVFEIFDLPKDKTTSLFTSISLSYDDLKPQLQGRFRALGIFAEATKMRLAAVQVVWGDEDDWDTETDLEFFEDQSLLTQDEDGDGFYRMHDLVSNYAQTLLGEGEHKHYQARYHTYLLVTPAEPDHIEANRHQFESINTSLSALTQFDEMETIEDAQVIAEAIRASILETLGDGDIDLREQLFDSEAIARAQMSWAQYANDYGMLRFVIRHGWFVLALTNDPIVKLDALLILTSSLSRTGRLARAVEISRTAEQLAQDTDQISKMALARNHIGVVYAQNGELDAALEQFQSSLKLARQTNDKPNEARALNNIGNIAYFRGQLDEAATYYAQSAEAYIALDDKYGAASILNNTGLMLRSQNKYIEAMENYKKALEISEERQHHQLRILIVTNLIDVCRAMGDLQLAAHYGEMAHQSTLRTVSDAYDGRVSLGLGVVALYRGDYAEAKKHLEHANELMAKSEFSEDHGAVLDFLGRTHYNLGEFEKAVVSLDKALEAWQQFVGEEMNTYTVNSTVYKALILYREKNIAEAQQLIEPVLTYVKENGIFNVDEPVAPYVVGYEIFRETDLDRAQSLLREGYDLLQMLTGQFTDKDQRAKYMKNIPANRRLLTFWDEQAKTI